MTPHNMRRNTKRIVPYILSLFVCHSLRASNDDVDIYDTSNHCDQLI